MLTRGRLPKVKLEIGEVRSLTVDDLACLRTKRTVPVVARFRDPHHKLARLIAMGIRPKTAAEECGFSIARVYTLHSDPSFMDLVAKYRNDVTEEWKDEAREVYASEAAVKTKALRTIAEHFEKAEEENELVPLDKALRVYADLADRVGPQKKSTVTNVNIDFAKNLERARQLRDASRAQIIDVEATTIAPPEAAE
jgi:hypothetical protein